MSTFSDGFLRQTDGTLVTVDAASAQGTIEMVDGFLRDSTGALVVSGSGGSGGGTAASTTFDDSSTSVITATNVQDALVQLDTQSHNALGVSKWVSGTGWPSVRPNYALVRFSGPGQAPTAWAASTPVVAWQPMWYQNNLYAWTGGNPASPTSGTTGATFTASNWQQIPVQSGDVLGFYS